MVAFIKFNGDFRTPIKVILMLSAYNIRDIAF